MLYYAGEYCNACQLAVTVIMNRDSAVKSCIERLIVNYTVSK